MQDYGIILAEKIKTLRKEMEESQIEFAFNCDISTESLSMIECAKGNPTLDTLIKIAAYTGVSLPELFESTE